MEGDGMSVKNAPLLFENFSYGMPRDEVIAKTGSVPCPEAPNNPLLICAPDNVEFLGCEWRVSFWFNNLDELQQVVLELMSKFTLGGLKVEERMLKAGWTPVCLESGHAVLDLLEKHKKLDIQNSAIVMSDFSAQHQDETNLSIFYFPLEYFQKVNGKSESWSQAVDEAPESLVVARLVLGADRNKIFFTAPLLSRKNALRHGEMIKRK